MLPGRGQCSTMEISWDEAGIELQWINREYSQRINSHIIIFIPEALVSPKCSLHCKAAAWHLEVGIKPALGTACPAWNKETQQSVCANSLVFLFRAAGLRCVTAGCLYSTRIMSNAFLAEKKCRLWPHINPISMVLTFDFNFGTVLGILKSRTKWKEMLSKIFFLLKMGTII